MATFNGQGINFLNPAMKNPYSERWTFGLQREVMHEMVLEIAYIGNHAVHLPVAFTQLNGIPRQYLSTVPYRDTALNSTLTATVPNPFAGLLPGTNLDNATVAVQQLLAPFPQYPVSPPTSVSTGVTERNANLGSSYFHSLNVRLEKHLSHGVQLVGTYIWSKLMERDEWLNNTDPAPEKRISPFDHTQRFVTAVNYDLPVGRGKLVRLQSRWLHMLAGGWRLNGIYTHQTGAPIPWLNNSSNNPGDYPLCSVPTVGGFCPIVNGVPQAATSLLSSSLNLNKRNVDGIAFDTSRFVTASGQQFAFHIRTFPSTFSNLRQDGQNNLDASILKKFDITERTYFQFRLEAFNLLNHPTFGAPNTQVTSSSFGKITGQANRSRQLQLGFRYVF